MSAIRGWCPTAWQPMAAGDGLLVRVRPRLARLSREQVAALCEVAQTHGNGLIDLTNRAALQIRGLSAQGWPRAIERLVAVGLVDPDPVREARAALLVAPDWRTGDDTHRIATAFLSRIDELPSLPGKFGIAIDAGAAAALGDDPADFRIERGENGALILRADGRPTGALLSPGAEVEALLALSSWFVHSGGLKAGRMSRHRVPLPAWAVGDTHPAYSRETLAQGAHPLGVSVGVPFGRIEARRLSDLVRWEGIRALRLTPWRIAILEGAIPGAGDPMASDPVLLSVDACVGAPGCPQATVETRTLAERLAPYIEGRLHVSGCAKGCARGRPAAIVLTGCDGLYDLAFDARAGGPAALASLTPAQVLAHFGAP